MPPPPDPRSPTPGPRIVILADDLTGACDTAQPFATGMPTGVLVRGLEGLDRAPAAGWQALSVNARTRSLDAAAARAATGEILKRLGALARPGGPDFARAVTYKKIDSTLRGNVAAELGAVADAFPDRPVFVAPAFPAMGRTTREGRVLVRGVPVDQTEYAADPRHPVRESSLLRLLAEAAGPSAELVSLAQVRAGGRALGAALDGARGRARFIFLDAETDEDLETIAQTIQAAEPAPVVLAGSAGLAAALARAWAGRGGASAETAAAAAALSPILVVIGTRHPATARQVEWVCREGLAALIPVHPEHFVGDRHGTQACMVGVRARAALAARQHLVLHVAGGFVPDLSASRLLADLVDRIPPGAARALVISGGGTADAVLNRLDAWGIELLGAPKPPPGCGLGALRGGRSEGLRVILKAGGFGAEKLLGDLLATLGFFP